MSDTPTFDELMDAPNKDAVPSFDELSDSPTGDIHVVSMDKKEAQKNLPPENDLLKQIKEKNATEGVPVIDTRLQSRIKELPVNPDDAAKRFAKKIVDDAQGNPDQAVNDLSMIDQMPEDQKAQVYGFADKYKQVKPRMDKLAQQVNANPNNTAALNDLADSYLNLGHKEEALSLYTQAQIASEQKGDANWRSLNGIGSVFQQSGMLDDAKESFSKAVAANPENTLAMYNLGSIEATQGYYNTSNQFFDKLKELQPDNPMLWKITAENKLKMGDEAGAKLDDATYKMAWWSSLSNMPDTKGAIQASGALSPPKEVMLGGMPVQQDWSGVSFPTEASERLRAISDAMEAPFNAFGEMEVGTIQGFIEGAKQFGKGVSGLATSGNYSSDFNKALNTINGIVTMGFSGAMAVSPGVNAAFHALPEEANRVLMQPFDVLFGLSEEDKKKMSENEQLRLQLYNTLGSIIFLKHAHGILGGVQDVKDVKDYTKEDINDLKSSLNKVNLSDVGKVQQALASIPLDMPAEQKAAIIPLIMKRNGLEIEGKGLVGVFKDKNKIQIAALDQLVAEQADPTLAQERAKLTNKIDEILSKDEIKSRDLLKVSDLEDQLSSYDKGIESDPRIQVINDKLDKIKEKKDALYQNESGIEMQKDAQRESKLNEKEKELRIEKQKIKNELLQKPKSDAVQIKSTGSVLQRQPEEVGKTGSERTGVEQSEQGQEAASQGAQENVAREVKEGDTVQIPSRIEGGRPRTVEFRKGEWQERFGDKHTKTDADYTKIDSKSQGIAQSEFEKQNENITDKQLQPTSAGTIQPEESVDQRPIETTPHATQGREEVKAGLFKLRDAGLLVTADRSASGKVKTALGVGKKVPMTDGEIHAQVALLDAMATAYHRTTGKDDFYDKFIKEVKAADRSKFTEHGGVLFQDESVPNQPVARVSLAVFDNPLFEKMRDQQVSPQSIADLVKSRGKQIEKDIINEVLSYDKYKQKRISFNEFKNDVDTQVMKLERIYTSSYARYGMDNLGDTDYGTAQTVVFNSPIEHGQTGHFSGDFVSDQLTQRTWEARRLGDTDVYAAVDKEMPEGIPQEELSKYVGTAGGKGDVENWIRQRNESAGINKGLFGHIRKWVDEAKKIFHIAELQSDFFQKNKASDLLAKVDQDEIDTYMNKNVYSELDDRYSRDLRAKFGFDVKVDGDKVTVSKDGEILFIDNAFDYSPFPGYDNLKYAENQAIIGAASLLGRRKYAINPAPTDVNQVGHWGWNNDKFIVDKTFETKEQADAFIESMQEQADEIHDAFTDIRDQYGNERRAVKASKENEFIKKRTEELLKESKPGLQLKQFVASQKIHEIRLLRESFKLAAEEGAKTVRFPNPYTVALIEGYASEGDGLPYEILSGDSEMLVEGDTIDFGGTKLVVVESDMEEITVAPESEVFSYNINDYISEETNNRVTEIEYEAEKHFGDIKKIKKSELEDYSPDEWMGESAKEALVSYFERNPRKKIVAWSEIKSRLEDKVMESYSEMPVDDLLGYGRGQVFLSDSGKYATVVESRTSLERLSQPDQYEKESSEDNYEDNLSSGQATVINKYKELNAEFKKLRPDAREVTDNNGRPWLESDITEADKTNPVIAFQKEGAKAKGAIDFMNNNKATVHIFDGADISTLAHEMSGHIGRRVLEELAKTDKEFAKSYKTVKKWAGVKEDVWTRRAEEMFARGFEKYLRNGEAPTPELRDVFSKMKEWLTNIYESIKGSAIDVRLTDEVKDVFDKLLGKETDKESKPTYTETEIANEAKAKKLGYDSQVHAVNSVNKRLGTDYKIFDEIPEKDLQEAVKERTLEADQDVKGITKEELKSEWDRIGIDDSFKDGLKQDFGNLADKAKNDIESGRVNVDELAQEYADNINKPVSDENLALLLTRKRQLQNLLEDVAGEDTPESRIVAAALQDKYEVVLKGTNNATTTAGRALRSVQMALEKDFSLASMKAQIKNIKGEALTEAELKHIEALHQEIQELRKKNEQYEKDKTAREASQKKKEQEQGIDKLTVEAAREKKIRRTASKEYLKSEREQLFKKLQSIAKESRSTLSANPIPAKMLPVLTKLAKNYIKDGLLTTEQWIADIHDNLKGAIAGITVDDVKEAVFGKRQKPTLDRAQMALKAAEKKAQEKFDTLKKEYQLKNRTKPQRLRDLLLKWQRFAILSGVKTLGKLTAAAAARQFLTSTVEEAIGWGISKALPKIAKDAPREGGYNVRAEAKNIAEAFKIATYKDILQTAKTGKGELDLLYGKGQLPPEALDFFGQLHSAFKTMPKRGEFFRSFEKRMEHAIRNGADATDPLVQAEVAAKAYEDGQQTIFMNDNAVVSAYQGFLKILENKGAGGVATAMRFLLPIVKIPSNFIAETTSYLGGSLKAANVLRKGIENLTPDQKDYVIRNLKKQTLGATLLTIGFLNPGAIGGYYQQGEKRKDNDTQVGDIRMFGIKIPHVVLHAPAIEMLQFGATIRRIVDSYTKKHKEGGVGKGLTTAIWGVGEQQPFIGEAGRIKDELQEGKSPLNSIAKGFLVPRLIQEVAESIDAKEGSRNFSNLWMGETQKRKTDGLIETIESGVPVQRETLKKKE